MAQKAVLKFVTKLDGNFVDDAIHITNREYVYSHHGIKANDFTSPTGRDIYMLAPFDCKIKAIRNSDNTIFFESLSSVQTPSGLKEKVSFTCTHMSDAKKSEIETLYGKSFAVDTIFYRGEILYCEGSKPSVASHIHMNQAFGGFNGGTSPSYLFYDNGEEQYMINANNESRIDATFYSGCNIVINTYYDETAAYDGFYSWQADTLNLVLPSVSPISTMKLTCTRASMASGYYPTRPTLNGQWDSTDFLIAPGDILKLEDIRVANDGNVVCLIDYSLVFNRLEDLSNRWVVYDKDYFN